MVNASFPSNLQTVDNVVHITLKHSIAQRKYDLVIRGEHAKMRLHLDKGSQTDGHCRQKMKRKRVHFFEEKIHSLKSATILIKSYATFGAETFVAHLLLHSASAVVLSIVEQTKSSTWSTEVGNLSTVRRHAPDNSIFVAINTALSWISY
jgi:hypothetical protein